MMTLDPSHPVVYEKLLHFLSTSGDLSEAEVKISDYDDITYLIHGISPEVLTFTAIASSLPSIGSAGGYEALSEFFQGHSPSIEGTCYTLVINRGELPPIDSPSRSQAASAIARKFSVFKMIFMAGPFQKALKQLKSGGGAASGTEIDFRPREKLWILPGNDRVNFVFQVHYSDNIDANLGKVFVQEFMEARRQVKNAPVIAFTPNCPDYLTAFAGSSAPCAVGYMSVTILADQITNPEKQAQWLCGFKQYLSYHIHACKTYLRMRIRKRTDSLLTTLKLAVPEHLDEKVFRRTRATKVMKEETKIIHNFKK